MDVITQGEDAPVRTSVEVQHIPIERESQKTPKKSQNNNKFGKKGRCMSYQSPQRPSGPARGGQQGRNLERNHQPPHRQGGYYDHVMDSHTTRDNIKCIERPPKM